MGTCTIGRRGAKRVSDEAVESSFCSAVPSSCELGTPSCNSGTSSVSGKGAGKANTSTTSTLVGTPFPKRPWCCRLSKKAWAKLEEVFSKMDPDGSNVVTKEEAMQFFKGAFGKISAHAMFNEVDVDNSGAITAAEFVTFWLTVRKHGYKEKDIMDELDELLEGGAWVDWKDGRDVDMKQPGFPKRPMLCRLRATTWNKCEQLFRKMDSDNTLVITHEKASNHFKGTFTKLSVESMFNEIDQNRHGQISADEWMKFWLQVRASGYKDKDIADELENLLDGGAWVDWKDGRNVC
mmetsp:Transcript_54447/g.151691  ORF Transcript_54447/g.151691 Transcript_54447/m.151691 type:complete len:293 (-) Transcript_54447:166-1044(-)